VRQHGRNIQANPIRGTLGRSIIWKGFAHAAADAGT